MRWNERCLNADLKIGIGIHDDLVRNLRTA
jgi:hypothetical protein